LLGELNLQSTKVYILGMSIIMRVKIQRSHEGLEIQLRAMPASFGFGATT
jgi:hypothetical protein